MLQQQTRVRIGQSLRQTVPHGLRAVPAPRGRRIALPRLPCGPVRYRDEKQDGATPASEAAPLKAPAPAPAGAPATNGAPKPAPKQAAVDGNEATARMAYALSDVSFIYPITPATPMGELSDQWAAEGRKNVFGHVMQVTEMESEGGVAGALHGALAAGALATTFTCSQGLLLMIPNMYKIAGELIPCVLHVTARALAGHALSIFGDHQDVMAVRQTGWAMLCSHSVQEAQDMALVAHLATLKARVPFVHFFDGFRTSHEINKIDLIDPESIKPLVAELAPYIEDHRKRALNPAHPHQRGTAQGPDVYFQGVEAANPFHQAVPALVQEAFDKVAALTGRQYRLFDYVGHPEADRVVVAMGSGSEVLEAAVEHLNKRGQKVGLIKVRLFRPWSAEHLLAALPATVKRITVMDRTKEHGSGGEPLLLDVSSTIQRHKRDIQVLVGGRYGLGSKDFTPAMGVAIFNNMAAPDPAAVKDGFVVGIVDDVGFSHLSAGGELEDAVPEGTTEGMGSDGTVGANKEAVKIIAGQEGMHAQAYFAYDAHKSGGVTTSHLRFGRAPIKAPYLVADADYIGVHQAQYLVKYDVLSRLRKGGVVLINAPWKTLEEVEAHVPERVKQQLARLRPRLYTIDATSVAKEVGLGRRTNMVMQAAFFALSGVMPLDQAIPLLKASIKKAYGKKGDKIVNMNNAAVDAALDKMVSIDIPQGWRSGEDAQSFVGTAEKAVHITGASSPGDFLNQVVIPMLAMDGDKLPVSVFAPGGTFPPGTTAVEKRSIADAVPVWDSAACTQCNICAFVCPHAAIRPALATPDELAGAPAGFGAVPIRGGGPALKGYQYRVQVSPQDCTGCELCVNACPDSALKSTPIAGGLFEKATVRGSQFQTPLMEFSGACEGCGETPYVKLLTQLFGRRMVVANATGCSSIWGGSAPANPYTCDSTGHGPAWANSLFEDNAQFGFGIRMGIKQRREALAAAAEVVVSQGVGSEELRAALGEWLKVKENGALAATAGRAVEAALGALPAAARGDVATAGGAALAHVAGNVDLLDKPSVWIIGGDGWAYDIGFAGLDHVFSTGEDVNILVLDTEEYSNTGGQKSKSTPLGAVVKFAAGGKARPKKELTQMAMMYPDTYVASVCLEANYNQVVKAMTEAEAHPGVSLVVAYAPCALQGPEGGMSKSQTDARMAVETGYWPLFRYQPAPHVAGGNGDGGEAPRAQLVLDSKKLKPGLEEFLDRENRFTILTRKDPAAADELHHQLDDAIHARHERLTRMAAESKKAAPQPPPAAPEQQ
ncbi:putative pyruvate-flavodoxinoxidoreductase [Monoraphidium neglectum]|uniref:Putative pyruvate-flavodoxinoxidoreductase n=1 Tax=Monoraphidium neglectum TaxID=145388 RepID=A0A0D2JT45_9CHLO|nr:putative pyruvate-flavodoxinoxidoreductase [Monoraphidium neglectum]KIZ02108.1 putative pyruvate-flavodoxinoxidoreductase [Monoraphidium neglectum]|eukprot:XP_013901127.1 putative pyruvate-flavodoxinoxidoreductase [Monoraphidium neglectum]